MKRLIAVSALALTLTACTGSSVGIGAGTGFPGIGLGAGVSVPVGKEKPNNGYLTKVKNLVKDKIDNLEELEGQRCKIRLTAADDGMLADVKRESGDEEMCDAVMTAFYKFNKLPAPPANMIESLSEGVELTVSAD